MAKTFKAQTLEEDRRAYQYQLVEIAARATAGVQAAWPQGEPVQLAQMAIEYAARLIEQAAVAAVGKYPDEDSMSSAGHDEPEPRAQ